MALCYLFNVPPVSDAIVKRTIESLIDRPNAAPKLTIDKVGDLGAICVRFDKIDDRNELYAKRKSLRIDGRPIVVMLNRRILGETTALVRSGTVKFAEGQLKKKPDVNLAWFNALSMTPAKDEHGQHTGQTVLSSKKMSDLIRFESSMQQLIFPEHDDNVENDRSEERPKNEMITLDMLESMPPLEPTPTKLAAPSLPCTVLFDNKYVGQVDCADILDESTDGIVLLVNPDLTPHDYGLAERLRGKKSNRYASFRKRLLETHGTRTLQDGACIGDKADTLGIPAKFLLHLSTNIEPFRSGSMEKLVYQLILYYESILMTAAKLELDSVSICIIATEFAVEYSAHAAAESMKEIMERYEAFKMPKRIRFVDMELEAVQNFAKAFQSAAVSGKSKTPAVVLSQEPVDNSKVQVVDSVKWSKDSVGGATTHQSFKLRPEDDEDDANKLSEATGYTVSKEDVVAASSVVQQDTRPELPKSRFAYEKDWYEKLIKKDKLAKKAMTKEEKQQIEANSTKMILQQLASWPDQRKCWGCDQRFDPVSRASTSRSNESKESIRESCLRCHRQFHATCFDKAGGICTYCIKAMKITPDGRCEEQPTDGHMEVKVVDDAGQSPPGFPDCRGHIEITYVFPCGTRKGSPDNFYIGCTRMAYLPNNEDGKRICELLSVAFERGLLLGVGEVGAGYGDHGVIWGCIPHKLNLTGGRLKWGYPDETYPSRMEKLLKENFGIEASTQKKEDDRKEGGSCV